MMTATRLDAFRQAAEKDGLALPEHIVPGRIVRFPGIGKSNGNKSGWAWLSEDGLGGACGDWASGLSKPWHAHHDHAMTTAELAAHTRRVTELRRIRQEEEANQHTEAAQCAQTIWDQAAPAAEDHPYLQKKRIQPHGLRVDDENRLIVPVTINGAISSLQFIDATGAKLFLPGGAVKGGTFTMGALSLPDMLLLCEGFATGASLHEATGSPTICAFSAGNLLPVAQAIRQQFPTAMIVICGDHDLSGTGQRVAREAASAVNGVMTLPKEQGQDFNDVHVQRGLGAVQEAIETAIRREEMRAMNTTTGDAVEEDIWGTHPKGTSDLSIALVNYTDLLSLEIPKRPRYLPWLPEGGNVMAYGPRGVGKTFFGLGLAVALTTGRDLLKWKVPSPVGVLYVDGEMQLDELRQRTTALMATPPVAPLEFLTGQLVYQRCGGKDLILTSDAMRQEVVTILDARPELRVLILDNISCLFSGLNEDSKQDWEPINAWLIRLRHRGLATVLAHHAGKGGQQRGTSGREDNLDTVLHLAKPTGVDAREGCHFELSFTKCRSVTGDDVGPLDVRLSTVNGQLEWVWQPMEVSMLDRARQLVKEGVEGGTALAEELGITKGYASKILKKLKAEAA